MNKLEEKEIWKALMAKAWAKVNLQLYK